MTQNEERFRITTPVEILSALRDAQAQGALLTLRASVQRDTSRDTNDATITTLLEVDAAEKLLVLDACADAEMTAKVTSAHTVTVETEVRRIRIHFDTGRAAAVTHEGRPALRIPLPEYILRIQRRDAYRIDTPPNEIVNCRFAPPALPRKVLTWRVADVSVQGMRIVGDPEQWQAQAGKTLKDCRIDLPDAGVVFCSANVVRVMEDTQAGKRRLLIGCEFVQPTGSAGTLLQKYILELERKRLARLHGNAFTPAYS